MKQIVEMIDIEGKRVSVDLSEAFAAVVRALKLKPGKSDKRVVDHMEVKVQAFEESDWDGDCG